MSDTDAITEALSEVDVDGDDRDDRDDREGDALDAPDDNDNEIPELDQESESEGFDLFGWAKRSPDGSHLDFEAKEWWDPETGGTNRLAFHLSDLSPSDGVGYPNGVGVLVGAAEAYVARVLEGDDNDNGEGGEPDERRY